MERSSEIEDVFARFRIAIMRYAGDRTIHMHYAIRWGPDRTRLPDSDTMKQQTRTGILYTRGDPRVIVSQKSDFLMPRYSQSRVLFLFLFVRPL